MSQTDFWRAVATLRLERTAGLAALESVFGSGVPPVHLNGQYRGRFLAFTPGRHLDPLTESLANLWMPWQGKVFDATTNSGRNLLSAGARGVVRALLPRHPVLGLGNGLYAAFPFETAPSRSLLNPDVAVLRLDYRPVLANPAPVRRLVDELVDVGDGVYLGQALADARGSVQRWAWFSLQSAATPS